MKVLIISDLHLGKKVDDFFINYQKEYLLNLIPIIKEHGCEKIIITGDINDKRKVSDNKIVNIFRDVFSDIYKQTNCEFIVTCGNHDMYYKNSHSYNSIQNFFSDDVKLTIVDNDSYKNENMVFVPWITEENYADVSKFISENNKKENYLFGHFELKGFKMTGNYACKHSHIFKSDYENYKKVFSGHFHGTQEQDNVLYVGNPWQTSFGELENKGCWILDNDNDDLHFLCNTKTLFEKHIIKDGLKKKEIEEILSTITDKFVKVYIDSNNDKYINTVEMIIETLKPLTVDISVKDIDAEIDDENISDEFEGNINDEYFKQLEMENTDRNELKELFEDYERNTEL